jgi:zinc protease
MKHRWFVFAFLLFCAPAQAMEVTEVTSAKGIKAWLVEDHSLPVVSLAFAWRGGVEQDAPEKQGLSMLGTEMLMKGAGADDGNAFARKLQENAISLDFDARRDSIAGQMRSLKETLPAAIALLKASLTAPRFDADALARQKAQSISLIRMYRSEPDWLLSRMMVADVFKDHPYERRSLGTEATVTGITPADLQNWHRHFGRSGLLVAATGDITRDELKAMLDDVFGGLPEKTIAAPVAADTPQGGGKIALFRYETPQSSLLAVFPGIARKDPRWYAYEVMNYILGGGSFSSRLMDEIREKRGLTYGIYSGASNYDHVSLFTIQASMQNENAGKVLALIKTEMQKMRNTPVSAEEVKDARDYLIGSYALGHTSTTKVADYLLELQRLGLTAGEQEKRAAAIARVTPEDVQKIAAEILDEKKMALFAIGAPQGITPDKTLDKVE